jgi:alkylation response protein AidB-like acyl-CoA dehydrogenase
MFRDTISQQDKELVFFTRDLVTKHIAPRALDYDTHGNDYFDGSALDILAEHNLLAPIISPDYGGRGLSALVTAMILEEIGAACAGVAASVAANIHSITPLLVAGTDEQLRQYLPLMTAPKTSMGAIAMVENGINLDILLQTEKVHIRGSSLKAQRDDQENIIINGSKDYVMNAAAANFITAMVEYDNDSDPVASRFQLMVIPMDTPGIIPGESRRKLGLRYCSTSAIQFKELKVEPQFMIGSPGSGVQLFRECLLRTVPFIGAICVGVARAAYQHALEVSKERKISGHPVFQESAVSHSLVSMASKLNAARLSVHHACWTIDQNRDFTLASPQAKIVSSQAAQDITSRAMEIVGGQAYVNGNKAEKYLRDAKMLSIVDGSEQFHRCLLASQL